MRAISRGVIDNDHFEPRIILRSQGKQEIPQASLAVVGQGDYADQWRLNDVLAMSIHVCHTVF
jgi:hypothetical protein